MTSNRTILAGALLLALAPLAVAAAAAQEAKPKEAKPQEAGKEKSAEAPADKTYKSKSPRFQVTAPADKAWDFLADESAQKTFLVPRYKGRCVTFFHDVAGKKDILEVSITAIDKKEAEFDKLVATYKGNLEDHFSDTKIFEVNDKAKFKGKKATSFKVEGRLKQSEGVVLVLESYVFEHKEHLMLFEVAADGPATREKYKKDLVEIEKSLRFL